MLSDVKVNEMVSDPVPSDSQSNSRPGSEIKTSDESNYVTPHNSLHIPPPYSQSSERGFEVSGENIFISEKQVQSYVCAKYFEVPNWLS